ncbi:MAG: fatty acid--CoA ligase [Congregibacter sp.]
MTNEITLSIPEIARPDRIDSHKIALQLDGTEITYGELDESADNVAAYLLGTGVKPHERIVIVGRNSLESIIVLIGVARVGAVSAFINWRLLPCEIAPLIRDCEPRVVFSDKDFAAAVSSGADSTTSLRIVAMESVLGDAGPQQWREDAPPRNARATRALLIGDLARTHPLGPPKQEAGNAPSAETTKADRETASLAALQLYTSGTTGLPKGAILTRAGLSDSLIDALDFWGVDQESVVLSVLPMYHIAGLGLAIATLWAGASLVISTDASASATLRYVESAGVTHLILASSMLQESVADRAFESTDFSSLQTLSYGAAPITVSELQRAIRFLSCRIVQPYGLTETSGVLTLLDDEDHRHAEARPKLRHRLASCGKARPGVELRLVDPSTGLAVAEGEAGEIQVRSTRVMSGYWRLPEATADAIIDGNWFRTGDVGTMDADGYVTLIDRLKDIIISGGENIYPQEVEIVLRAHPQVLDVAVVGAPHDKWGETPIAVIVAASGPPLDSEAIIQFARARLAHYKCPTAVLLLDALPRNATGKVLRKELRSTIASSL